MKKYVGLIMIVCMFAMISNAWAAPQKMNFQGKLTDAAGNPINGSVSMTFKIWDALTGGNQLWTEPPQTVPVNNGIYNVFIGQNNPIDTELTETKPLWLGVTVGSDAEMSPRVALTPGMYDLIMMNMISVKNGNVGIGVASPETKLQVAHGVLRVGLLLLESFSGATGETIRFDRDFIRFWSAVKGTTIMDLQSSGAVNIYGTLHVTGADLAEPFDMTDSASLELGDVVVIDPLNPLHVTKSTTAYDTTVAGIVSSTTQAGYVAGSRSDGSSDKPVALAGRVVCNVSTENGAIKIGDLLTTASTPGYAMKATDFERRQGAILGKALQAFDGGNGQILVLVTLQ